MNTKLFIRQIPVLCLTVITIVDILLGTPGLSLILWIGYGIYSIFKNNL